MSSGILETRSVTIPGLATFLRWEEDPYDKYWEEVDPKLSCGSHVRILN